MVLCDDSTTISGIVKLFGLQEVDICLASGHDYVVYYRVSRRRKFEYGKFGASLARELIMAKGCYLVREEHIPQRAAFPVIDAHNHLWVDSDPEQIVSTMDAVGVVSYCDLTANFKVSWTDGGAQFSKTKFEDFITNIAKRYPGRFYGFTMASFAVSPTEPLFTDAEQFAQECVELLRRHVGLGARGLKIMKDLGLNLRDADGNLIAIDDARLADIWEAAAQMDIPVLVHQSDPCGFFAPPTPENEHYETLLKFSDWSFSDPQFPRKTELLQRRDNLVRRHPKTTFILAHVANFCENLGYVSQLLDENPNVYIDLSARIDELGRQPYSAREFFIRYQDRILFGSDMPASPEVYRSYFRFLETFDEYFFPPYYDGTFEQHRWAIYGIGLPKEVLAKVYYQNALKIIPGLKEDLKNLLPDGM